MNEKEIKDFLMLAYHGDYQVVEQLEKDTNLRGITDSNKDSLFDYLINGNKFALIKIILSKKLSDYGLFKESMNKNMMSATYKKDNKYEAFLILNEEDKEDLILKNLANVIELGNLKTINHADLEKIVKRVKSGDSMGLNFFHFAICGEAMLKKCLNIYKELLFNEANIQYAIKELNGNKEVSLILMKNLTQILSKQAIDKIIASNEFAADCFLHKK